MKEQQLFQLGNGATGFSCDGVAVGAWPIFPSVEDLESEGLWYPEWS